MNDALQYFLIYLFYLTNLFLSSFYFTKLDPKNIEFLCDDKQHKGICMTYNFLNWHLNASSIKHSFPFPPESISFSLAFSSIEISQKNREKPEGKNGFPSNCITNFFDVWAINIINNDILIFLTHKIHHFMKLFCGFLN